MKDFNNREILFRAKTKTGEWVYGFPVKKICATGSAWHMHTIPKDPDDYSKIVEILEETICQYTGVNYSCDGSRCFEGDIVEVKKYENETRKLGFTHDELMELGEEQLEEYFVLIYECKAVIKFEEGIYGYWNRDFTACSYVDDFEANHIGCWPMFKSKYIGNIFDNPEMIEQIDE